MINSDRDIFNFFSSDEGKYLSYLIGKLNESNSKWQSLLLEKRRIINLLTILNGEKLIKEVGENYDNVKREINNLNLDSDFIKADIADIRILSETLLKYMDYVKISIDDYEKE